MATVEIPQAPPLPDPPEAPRLRRSGRYRFTLEQFYWLDQAGFFPDRHVELLDGEIYEMVINPPHAAASDFVKRVLEAAFGPGFHAREQKPVNTGRRSLPEPDIAVVVGSSRDYVRTHPRTALLVVEVSDSTLSKDRVIKSHLYAQAVLPEYWIVNLRDRQIEVGRNPGRDPSRKGRFTYLDRTVIPADGRVSPLARPEAEIAVADLLP